MLIQIFGTRNKTFSLQTSPLSKLISIDPLRCLRGLEYLEIVLTISKSTFVS